MQIFCALVLIMVSQHVNADEITVGDEKILIFAPIGFEAVSPEMAPIYDLLKQFVPNTNIEFANYITDEDAERLRTGQAPTLERRFSIQAKKSQIKKPFSKRDFEALKTLTKNENNALLEEAKPQIERELSSSAARAGESTGTEVGFENFKVSPLPIHDETERSISYSMLMDVDVASEVGVESVSNVITVTIVELGGQLL
jgi:hypothetical protein